MIRVFVADNQPEVRLALGLLLLAIWLILWGLAAFIPALSDLGEVLAVLAIAAGVFIFVNR